MVDRIFTDADMEANVLEIGEWLEDLEDTMENSKGLPQWPLVWSNGTQVSFGDLDDEDRAALMSAGERFGWNYGSKLGAFEASARATKLIRKEVDD